MFHDMWYVFVAMPLFLLVVGYLIYHYCLRERCGEDREDPGEITTLVTDRIEEGQGGYRSTTGADRVNMCMYNHMKFHKNSKLSEKLKAASKLKSELRKEFQDVESFIEKDVMETTEEGRASINNRYVALL